MDRRSQFSWRSLLTFFPITILFLVLLFYASPSPSLGLNPRVSITERGFHDTVVTNLTKREEDPVYEKAVDKGNNLLCKLVLSEEAAKVSNKGVSLEAPGYLQRYSLEELEGWDTTSIDVNAPYFRNYLGTAFSDLGINKETVDMHWVNSRSGDIYDDPDDPDIDQVEKGVPTGAFFTTSFILDAGVIIADNNLAVKAAIDNDPFWMAESPVTHIRQWSDAVWMHWTRACAYTDTTDVKNVKYIIRSRVTNKSTRSILFKALIKKYGGSPTIGKWDDRLTLDVERNPGEFQAILGTPNGAASAYFLLNHKAKLGIKTIEKVDIFVPNIPYTVSGASVGDVATSAKIMLLFTVTTP